MTTGRINQVSSRTLKREDWEKTKRFSLNSLPWRRWQRYTYISKKKFFFFECYVPVPPGFRVSINIYIYNIYIARPFPFSCCHPVRTESSWRCTSSHSKEKWRNHFPFSWARQGHSLVWEEEREEIVVRSSSIVSTSSTHSFLSLSPVPHGIFVGLLPIIVTHREAVQVPELPTLPEHGSEKLGIFFLGRR